MQTSITHLLFFDIETVSAASSYKLLDDNWKKLWQQKVDKQLGEGETPEMFYDKRAAIMAEFGKIICISAGYFKKENNSLTLRVKSFYGHNEKELLQQLIASFNHLHQQQKGWCFCGHNIKEFDVPYLCRRLLVNGLGVPNYLDFQAMKPWETNLVDTLQLWKFGDYKNYTSLNLLAACLNIQSPKDDIDGSQVGHVYYQENDLDRIVEYCQKDVVTVAQIMLKLNGLPLIDGTQVVLVK